ncbi:LysR family transcriptional regulator [Amycolatopsis jiangsuensis]|uniref:DNA-binding transcriptional LysR family regulator n=1 Tax=Amycolatopsis jiangsuensis TaxID=1181879 RepID=A0A840J5N9_9PSEU|nr:LysR family transcriptional regulator [Amycolatopsis jiangsuensis]MBB4688737.1 DNA-binding transcriptional LysR family regulator [Amycolatopsis jiangsuensis]
MEVELRHLRAFVAVATRGTFTAAGRELRITQPALTRTIQQLEDAVGARLLERTPRGAEPTPAGGELLERLRVLLTDLDAALAAAGGHAGLRIGFQWALPDPWIGDLLAAFESSAGARARLVRRDDIVAALHAGEVDAALVRGNVQAAGIAGTLLFEEDRVAAVAAGSELAARTELEWTELARHPLVVNTVSGATSPADWSGGDRPGRLIECGSYDEWLTIVAAGRGIGSTTASAARAHTHAGVTHVPLRGAPTVPLRLLWPSRRSSDRLLRRFAELASPPR